MVDARVRPYLLPAGYADLRAADPAAPVEFAGWRGIGIPEAILAEGKDKTDLLAISLAHLQATGSVIITRISARGPPGCANAATVGAAEDGLGISESVYDDHGAGHC